MSDFDHSNPHDRLFIEFAWAMHTIASELDDDPSYDKESLCLAFDTIGNLMSLVTQSIAILESHDIQGPAAQIYDEQSRDIYSEISLLASRHGGNLAIIAGDAPLREPPPPRK